MNKRLMALKIVLMTALVVGLGFIRVEAANYDFYGTQRDLSTETASTLVSGNYLKGVTIPIEQVGLDKVMVQNAGTSVNYSLAVENDQTLGKNVLVSRAESADSTQVYTQLSTTQLIPTVTDGSTGNSSVLHLRMNFDYAKMVQFTLRADFRDGGISSGSVKNFDLLDINWVSSAVGTKFFFGDGQTVSDDSKFAANTFRRWDEFELKTWYDFTFVFNDNGDATVDSVDMYVNGDYMFTKTGFPGDFNQNIQYLNFFQYSKLGATEVNNIKVAHILTSKVNPIASITTTDQTMDSGASIDAPYALVGIDTNFDATLGLKSVTVSDPSLLTYDPQTNMLTAGAVSTATPVTVTFEAYGADKTLITETATVTIKPAAVLPTSIEQVELAGTIKMPVGATYDLAGLVKVLPEATDDKSLSYSVTTGSSVSLSGSEVTADTVGESKVTVVSNADNTVTKELTIVVFDGLHDGLNDYLPAVKVTEANTSLTDHWFARGYSKEFGAVETALDSIFGSKIIINGTGSVSNAGGSYADGEFSIAELGLNANKDYVLSGYVRIDGVALGVQRIDVKVFAMKDNGEGLLGAISTEAPFYSVISLTNAQIKNSGWVYFETGAINLDSFENISAINIELISMNNDQNVTASFAGLALIEQETVQKVDIKAVVNDEVAVDKTINLGQTLQVSGATVPSTASATFTYTSSDLAVATVNAQGLVTAVGNGQTTITISDGTFEKSFVLTVDNPIKSIASDKAEVTLEMTKNQTITLTINPENYVDTLVFGFSVAGIADYTVSGNTVTLIPQSLGSTVLTVSALSDPTVKTEVTIVVEDVSVTQVKVTFDGVETTTLDLNLDEQKQVAVTISPITRIDKNYQVVIADNTIVSINDQNVLTALKTGSTTVEFSLDGVKTTVTVTVTDPTPIVDEEPKDSANQLAYLYWLVPSLVVVIGAGLFVKSKYKK